MDGVALLTIFVLAVFVGFEVVSKVSTTLHTPLMSGRQRDPRRHPGRRDHRHRARPTPPEPSSLGLVAIVLATVNMVGGFVVTDRMLEMFKGRAKPARDEHRPRPTAPRPDGGSMKLLSRRRSSSLYLVAAVCFILALKGLSSPEDGAQRQPDRRRRARRSPWSPRSSPTDLDHIPLILVAIVVGTAVGRPGRPARRR